MPAAFSIDSHRQFAELSGDFNPIHMDAVAARRTQAGLPVVHGVHALLRLLEVLAAQDPSLPRPRRLKASFRRMIYVGDHAQLEVGARTDSSLRAHLLVGGVEVVSATLSFEASARVPLVPAVEGKSATPPPQRPFEPSLEQLEGMKGRLSFATPAARLIEMFPSAAQYLGAERIAALACSSALVGMVVPGLNSLYGELAVELDDDCRELAELAYEVTSVDPRFRIVRVAVRGGGIIGLVSAISRPPPALQPAMRALAQLVARDEFSGSDALVVGGSRGIGETTAKLVAAGGARVTLTYRQGRADAEAVAQEIRSWGGNCNVMAYDVQENAIAQLANLPYAPTHVYYFATPTIYKRKLALFDGGRFEEFSRYYLSGFLDLAQGCAALRSQGVVRFFYPSTVYVEKRPAEMTEYAMAKSAGEVLCSDMARYMRNVQVLMRRLPRVATDQTVSLVPMTAVSADDVMLPIAREMHAAP